MFYIFSIYLNITFDCLKLNSTYFISLDGASEVPVTNSTTGEVIIRDMVQFVRFTDYENDDFDLAENVLTYIPEQIEQYSSLISIL